MTFFQRQRRRTYMDCCSRQNKQRISVSFSRPSFSANFFLSLYLFCLSLSLLMSLRLSTQPIQRWIFFYVVSILRLLSVTFVQFQNHFTFGCDVNFSPSHTRIGCSSVAYSLTSLFNNSQFLLCHFLPASTDENHLDSFFAFLFHFPCQQPT